MNLPETLIKDVVESYCDFIEEGSILPRSKWLEFSSSDPNYLIKLYSRKGPYLIPRKSGNGMMRADCLVLANIVIEPKGLGLFTKVLDLLITVANSYKLPIVVELVHNKRLNLFLKRNNFIEYSTGGVGYV